VKDAPSVVLLNHLRVLEIIRVLRLLLGVKMVKRAIELAEAMRRGQMFVTIAEMVLAKLTGFVALCL
jgi:hypothetical protein